MNDKIWSDVYKTLILTKDEVNALETLINKALGEGLVDEHTSDLLAEIDMKLDEL